MKSKKIFFSIFLFFLFLFPVRAIEFDLTSKNAIIYNLHTGEVLYEKNSEEKIRIASLTKIMTGIVAIEKIDNLDDVVTINSNMLKGLIEANAAVVGFKVGDKVTYRDLLYGALLPSGADATQALAISLAGSEEEFVKLMNEKAISLGMENTHYTNTSGLDTENQYSTVKDVSLVLLYALNNPTFKQIYTTKEYTTTTNIHMNSTLKSNLNRYHLQADYIIGSKTGYTDLAGYCLSSIATYNGIDYLTVTAGADAKLNFPNNIIDTKKMLEYFFDHYEYTPIIKSGDILATVKNKYDDKDISILAKEDIYEYILKEDKNEVHFEYNGKEEISSFTGKKDKIGTVTIKLKDTILQTIDIYRPEKIDFNLFHFLLSYIYIIVLAFVLLLLFRKKRVKHGH